MKTANLKLVIPEAIVMIDWQIYKKQTLLFLIRNDFKLKSCCLVTQWLLISPLIFPPSTLSQLMSSEELHLCCILISLIKVELNMDDDAAHLFWL